MVGPSGKVNQVARPYLLQYAGAKEFNSSEEVTDVLQNIILQHADIGTFVRHYEVDVDVDIQGIIRKTGSQTPLDTVNKCKQKWDDCISKLDHANMACQATFRHLDEGALSKHHHHLQEKLELFQDQTMEAKRKYNKAENLEQYRNEQPVIDLECQLAGKLVDTKVMGALEHKSFMPLQHLMVIDATLSMPGATLEAEYQHQINMINVMTVLCPIEEGQPMPQPSQSCCRPVPDNDEPCPPAKRQQHFSEDETEITLCQVTESIWIKSPEEQPKLCFLCLGNANLPLKNWIVEHTTPGSLTRHFLQKHVNPPWPTKGVECNVYGMELLKQKFHLSNHAERCHRAVV
ncbi:hypothetical protein SI65_08215 [Aspergillus cristatus]|uniref:C2H2-type domain-containing protein n=1 Tax=Aspergillus cristatus TaxID=573508 RepID=A0A1E3B732_ASPCR|nr:hypothetical protein SI65_08215 [Aspergillus cristatus]